MLNLFFFFNLFLIFSLFKIDLLQKKKVKFFLIKFSLFFIILLIFYDFYIITKFIFFYKNLIIILKKFNIFLYNYFLYFLFVKKNIYTNTFNKTFFLKKQQQLNLNKIKIYAKQ
jgi:hypothetical protein